MKKIKLLAPLLGLTAVSTAVPTSIACSFDSKNSEIKNQQVGQALWSYYDACERSDNYVEYLNLVKDKLLQAFDKAKSVGQFYALGSIGGANESDKDGGRYFSRAGAGVFDAIARVNDDIVEEFTSRCLQLEEKIITQIFEAKSETRAEMIGLSASSLFEYLGNFDDDTLKDKITSFSEYIHDSINKVKNDNDAIEVGLASTGFYYACVARRNDEGAVDKLFSQFKEFIETLM